MNLILGLFTEWAQWRSSSLSLAILAAAAFGGLLIHSVILRISKRIFGSASGKWTANIPGYLAAPSLLLLPLLSVKLSMPSLTFPWPLYDLLSNALNLIFIAAVSYLLVRVIYLLRDFLLSRHSLDSADNLSARKLHTQVRLLEKALISIVAITTLAFMLMTFEGIRQIGISILASAGIAGVIVGLAAQKSIGNLLAGIQIAVTQPISMDDVVIVEGEWGRVEEITLTYVVIRVWDLRRLIVPISHFIEKPFQNWTRTSSDILGTVHLYADYGIPVELLRAEFQRAVKAMPLWNGKVCGLQVTDCKENVLEIRLLVSAASAGDVWDLRCQLRESMIAFIQNTFPEFLPRFRTELTVANAERLPVYPQRPHSEAGNRN